MKYYLKQPNMKLFTSVIVIMIAVSLHVNAKDATQYIRQPFRCGRHSGSDKTVRSIPSTVRQHGSMKAHTNSPDVITKGTTVSQSNKAQRSASSLYSISEEFTTRRQSSTISMKSLRSMHTGSEKNVRSIPSTVSQHGNKKDHTNNPDVITKGTTVSQSNKAQRSASSLYSISEEFTTRRQSSTLSMKSLRSMHTEHISYCSNVDHDAGICCERFGINVYSDSNIVLTASSSFNRLHTPNRAKLFEVDNHDGIAGWASSGSNDQWIQVDFGSLKQVTGVLLQGRGSTCCTHWVTSFRVLFSNDGNIFNSTKILEGTFDRDTVVCRLFDRPIVARYFRISPITWYGKIALRFDLLGCLS